MGNVPEASALPFYAKEVTLQALRMDNRPVRTPMLERVLRLVERGDLTPVVADTYGFAEVEQAHRDLSEGGYVGKLVVTP
jgi:NADPH:quinone reductase-like Zn-dependent oxidoreductase